MSAAKPEPGPTEFATSADGTRIAFDRTGNGPLVVIVEGAMSSRAFGAARDTASALAEHYTVIAYDRRGRGESGDTAPYAPEREFEDLRAVVDAVGGDAIVVGFSSGAGLAYRAAASGVPMKAIFGHEAPWVGRRLKTDGTPRDYVADLDLLIAEGRNGDAVDYFMTKMIESPWFMPVMMRMMRKTWKQLQAVAPTLPYDARIMNGDFEVPTDELARITAPTLVTAGSKSAPEMRKAQEKVAAAIPGAELRVLEGQSHMLAPAVLASELAEFLARVSR